MWLKGTDLEFPRACRPDLWFAPSYQITLVFLEVLPRRKQLIQKILNFDHFGHHKAIFLHR